LFPQIDLPIHFDTYKYFLYRSFNIYTFIIEEREKSVDTDVHSKLRIWGLVAQQFRLKGDSSNSSIVFIHI